MMTASKLDKKEIDRLNYVDDNVEVSTDKEGLLKQLKIWHKLSTQEQKRILDDNFRSEISRDNYTQSIILKYL